MMAMCSSTEKGKKQHHPFWALSHIRMDTDSVGNCFSLTVTASEGKIQMTNTNTNDNGNDKYLLESPRKDGGEAGVGEREGVEVGQSRQVARAQRGHRRRGEVEVLKQIRKYM